MSAQGPRERIAKARLYFVCDALESGARLESVLESALRGGVDIIQLRDKDAGEDELIAASRAFKAAAERHGALFILNDRADLVSRCGADGVHVGQDDVSVENARRVAGESAIVGLSSHRPEQFDAACGAEGPARPDYLSVGPVHETPTKPGRPAAGLEYVRHAASNATLPWFAIGGIDPSNVGEVAGAGARRVVVVRAIRDAPDPEAAALALREALNPSKVGA